jgi:hypothetical protein
MAKELHIPFTQLGTPSTITQNNVRLFKKHGLDIHRHEVEKLEDDHSLQKRVLRIKNTRYFGPWSKKS